MKVIRTAAVGIASGLALAPVPARAAQVPVAIAARAYQPAQLTVQYGQTVLWTNRGFGFHTVTALGGEFDSGRLALGESFSVTFTTPGTFAYKCTVHPSMRGSVTVLPPGQLPPPPTGSLRVRLGRRDGKTLVYIRAPAPGAAVLLQRGPPWRTVRRGQLSPQGKATLALGPNLHRRLRVVVQAGGPPLVGKPFAPHG